MYFSVTTDCDTAGSGSFRPGTSGIIRLNRGLPTLGYGLAASVYPRRPGFPDFGRRRGGDLHGPIAFLQGNPFADEFFHLVQLLYFIDAAE